MNSMSPKSLRYYDSSLKKLMVLKESPSEELLYVELTQVRYRQENLVTKLLQRKQKKKQQENNNKNKNNNKKKHKKKKMNMKKKKKRGRRNEEEEEE